MQEADSKQLLFEKSTLLVSALADGQSLTVRLASKSQEVVVLLERQQKCEAERQRLHQDLKNANAFKERIFATINQPGLVNDSPTDFSVSITNMPAPLNEQAATPMREEDCEKMEGEL